MMEAAHEGVGGFLARAEAVIDLLGCSTPGRPKTW